MANLWREALFLVNKHFRFSLPEASEQVSSTVAIR